MLFLLGSSGVHTFAVIIVFERDLVLSVHDNEWPLNGGSPYSFGTSENGGKAKNMYVLDQV